MLAGVTDCRSQSVGNGAAEEHWRWDLNLGMAAIEREDHAVLGEKGEDHAAW